MRTIDCSKFNRVEDLLDLILEDDDVVVLENDLNHPYFSKMRLPNKSVKFSIGDRVRLSKDLVDVTGIVDAGDNGTIVGIEVRPDGEYKYKCVFDNGIDAWYSWYDIELVASQKELFDGATLK